MIFLQTDLQRTLHEQRCHPSLSRKSYLRSRCIPDTPDSWNSGPLLRDAFWPIRGQCPGHVITLDQSEARISSDLMTASSLWFWQPTNWRACHFYIPGNLNISRIQGNLNLLMILYFDILHASSLRMPSADVVLISIAALSIRLISCSHVGSRTNVLPISYHNK